MLRYVIAGVLALSVVGLLRDPAPASSNPPAPVRAESSSPAAPAPAYRPGEPSLLLDAVRLTRADNGHFNATVEVDGQPLDMVVDTGATAVALTVSDAQRLGLAVDPGRFTVVGTGASGPVRGQRVTLSEVGIGGRRVAGVEAVVLEGLDRSLLGQSYLRRLERVEIAGDVMTLR